MFLAKDKVPTLDNVYQKILEVSVQDVEHLSLFAGTDFLLRIAKFGCGRVQLFDDL